MYLHQKFEYEVGVIDDLEGLTVVETAFNNDKPRVAMFDTETTGLNFMRDVPFLFVFGWNKRVYAIDLLKPNAKELVLRVYDLLKTCNWVFAHNAKYDYHMMINGGLPIPEDVNIADSQTVARLTNFADDDLSKSLETMGQKYVDPSAKFASHVIRAKLNEINKGRRTEVKKRFKEAYGNTPFNPLWEAYQNRVQYLRSDYDEEFQFFDTHYKEANYLDVYRSYPALMVNYAYDDIVIMLEWLGKALPILKKTSDPELTVFKREASLIGATASQERIGLKVDIQYILGARIRVVEHQKGLYERLRTITGVPGLTVGQHQKLIELFSRKYGVTLTSVDKKNLSRVKATGEVKEVVALIRKLRTVDKWLGTYIDGFLNRLVDGRVYTSIDLSGAVSGRVSSDMQQMPKEPLMDGPHELFAPRRAILADEDYELYFFDYSQQELRVQAYYTLLTSTGDTQLLRAYMPFKCTSIITGDVFDYTDPEVLKRWNSGEWVDENDNFWQMTDVHAETTFHAFPFLNHDTKHPEFSHYRKLGKVCNFLKNYQGGVDAIIDQLDVDRDTAEALDKAYYKAFPMIREYQRWVTGQLYKHGFVQNLYGRRYFMKNSTWYYKAGNYLVQGSCADMVKTVELKVDALLKGTKSAFVLPVHDEIIVRIHKDEKHLVKQIKAIMDDVPEVPWVPMICEVEKTSTNWADKEEVDVDET